MERCKLFLFIYIGGKITGMWNVHRELADITSAILHPVGSQDGTLYLETINVSHTEVVKMNM